MILKELHPRKALNKAFLKVKPNRTGIDGFKTNLITLLDRINETESEEFHKNLVSDFLKKTYYEPNYFINTKGRNDLVIHNGQQANSTVGVILEAKKPTNKAEMISHNKINVKAFQELVLYYLRERITHKNLEIKHLVATNIYEWFIFDATLFDRLFAQNKTLVKQFTDFEGGRLADTKTDFFYKHIAEPFIDSITSEIEFTHFSLPRLKSGTIDDRNLIPLFKIFSPEHLLKLPFTNDSNSLDKRFYSELLHIIGLTETKEGSKKLIERNKAGERHTGTILEDAIIQLDSLDKLSRLEKPNQFGNTEQERLFNVALELSITWINRILFLKLLEAQLITYHKGDTSYSFLNLDKIKSYDDLNSLFFQVLARKYNDRNDDVKKIFEKVPYLNSSLFEPTDIEQVTLFISNLKDDKTIPIFPQTVLKDQQGKKRTGNISTLRYLFEFLDAYDFGAEGGEEIQEDNKTLINASVLGLIFEKINGYKDGSFFTPGFITMYMCRETIRKAVIQKFNEAASKSHLERGFRGVSSFLEQGKRGVKREIIPYNPKLKEVARELRNNSTKSEIILWKELKGKFEGKYDFHRQKPLDNYIADFFCYELKLVIEIDGESHNWEETQQKDFQKETRFNELGLNVLRFPDTDIFKHLEATLNTIRQYITGFEKGDLSELQYEDSPLNPLTGNEGIVTDAPFGNVTETPIVPFSRGDKDAGKFMSLDDVYEQIGEGRLFTREQANNIINSIKICDPAVGSGHFLVSALNEIIAVKNDLKILEDREGKSLHRYEVEVVNDELIVTDEEGELFEYNPSNKESQRIQETLFHEKQTIIENCLFGVDINPNSVKICRLRLWIELLKNSYYIHSSSPRELQTLPNIDINIKCGNSLVSRFAIDADLKQALKKSKWTIDSYRLAVQTYRNATNKEQKREMERLIADIKSDFRSEISQNDPKIKKLRRLQAELFQLTNQEQLFGMTKKEQAEWNKKVQQLTQETTTLEAEIEEIKANKIFENAFEWRFEFPEVLNDDGDFVGFDVVIGNPPYGVKFENNEKEFFKNTFQSIHVRTPESYNYFIKQFTLISSSSALCCLIIPSSFLNQAEFEKTRNLVLSNHSPFLILNLGDAVFEDVATPTCIIGFDIQNNYRTAKYEDLTAVDRKMLPDKIQEVNNAIEVDKLNNNQSNSFIYRPYISILDKCYNGTPTLKDVAEDVATGISPGLGEAFVIKIEEANKNGLENEIIKKLIIGGEINRYELQPKSGKGIIYFTNKMTISDYPETAKHLNNYKVKLENRVETKSGVIPWYVMLRPRRQKLFEEPKILIRQTANRIIAAYDDEKWYCLKSGIIIQLPNESNLSYKYLVGLLNSSLMDFLYNDLVNEDNRIFPEVKPIQLFKLPIKIADELTQTQISNLVDKIIMLKKDGKETTEIEKKVDKLIFETYGLTEEEINIIENANNPVGATS